MDLSALTAAAAGVFSPEALVWLITGVTAGIILGAMPGISTNMAISLLFSFCYTIDGTAGVIMLLGVYCGGVYGGSISAILLNTPGTPANAATMLDGHPMARRGEPGRALGISTISSGFGGIFSSICLIFCATTLAKVSLKFTSLEYCAFAVFGISIISSVSSKSIIKGLIGGAIGLLLACVGIDPISGTIRYSFGTSYLVGGLPLIPLLIGLFAFSQALLSVEELARERARGEERAAMFQGGKAMTRVLPSRADMKRCLPTWLRSSVIGTVIGAIPGTGGDIASFISYNEAKRWSKHKEEFGSGCPEGIAAPEAGNNAVTGGAMIPMLSLGVPGDSCTAMLLGALTIKGISVGPTLFTSRLESAYQIFLGMFLSNVIMLIAGFALLRFVIKIVLIKSKHLIPLIFVLCFVGTYSFTHTFEDIIVMVAAGLVGYLAVKHEFTLSALVIGYILGNMTESNFRRYLLISGGDLGRLLERPLALVLFAAALATLLSPVLKKAVERVRARRARA